MSKHFQFILLALLLTSNCLSQRDGSIISTTPSLKKGYNYFSNKEFVNCIQHCDSLLAINGISLEEKYGAYELKAGSHYAMGDIHGGLKFKLKMMSYSSEITLTPAELYYAYDHLAMMYAHLNRVDDAIESSRKAYRSVRNNKIDTSIVILASNNLGYRLLLDGRNLEAIEYYNEGIQFYNEFHSKQENDSIIYHILLGNLGYIEGQLGDDSGIDRLKITRAYLDKKNFNRADPRIKLGKLYLLRKDYKNAELYLNEAYEIAHDYNQLDNLESVLYEKTLLYAATGDDDKLKKVRTQYTQLQNQLKIEYGINQELSELSELKLKQSENERKSLANRIQVDEQQERINNLLLLIALILVIAILTIILVLYRKRKTENIRQAELHEIKGKLLETQLEKETRELENIKKWFEIQKNEMSHLLVSSKTREEKLVNVIKELKDLKKENNSDVNSILSDIQIKLNSISGSPTENEIANLDNLQISAFRNALVQKHSNLTKNEIDLCKMIVSGMDSKKIGNVKNISPSSVRTNKSRLKKKLRLTNEQDLDQYLVQFTLS